MNIQEKNLIDKCLKRYLNKCFDSLVNNNKKYTESIKRHFEKELNKTINKIKNVNLVNPTDEDIFLIRDCILDYMDSEEYKYNIREESIFQKYNKLMWNIKKEKNIDFNFCC